MSEYILQPRLDSSRAAIMRELIAENLATARFDESVFREHLNAPRVFQSTGGRPVLDGELMALRQNCLAVLEATGSGSQKDSGVELDLALGKLIYDYSLGSRGEFGKGAVWDFLALVLLPDVVALRIGQVSSPQAVRARLTGGNRRHVLQRLWRRWAVFGPEIVERRALTEDDYVALLERRLTSERPLLARAVATSIEASRFDGSGRRDYTRLFMRRLLQASGIVAVVDAESPHIAALVRHVDREVNTVLGQDACERADRSTADEEYSLGADSVCLDQSGLDRTPVPTARRRPRVLRGLTQMD